MVVIESGGTKSTWLIGEKGGGPMLVLSVGLHPRELSEEKINVAKNLVQKHDLQGQQVYFYGAGCESKEAKKDIQSFLEGLGLVAVQVETDIYAACLAHLGSKPGIVGILGTGAVAARFDGEKVVQITSGLGYMLGDEGSGFDIGKRLLRAYFKKELPESIVVEIEAYFENKAILHRIYAPDGRMIVAGLTKIVHAHQQNGTIRSILTAAFQDFCKEALEPIAQSGDVYFVGSIAHYFEGILVEVLKNNNYNSINTMQEAAAGVYSYLSNN